MFKRVLLLSCASGVLSAAASVAWAATAQSDASSTGTAASSATVTEITVTADKRVQNLQVVPIAISAFNAQKRDDIGINSIQDMTNFTPGLTYSTSTDRITLRGVGRTTNVLSADTPVTNYDDGLYETFAVAAGRSSLELADVDIERGPQGTLGGRNALAGSLNEVTNRPTSTLQGEARFTYGNYDHITAEAAVSGPINDNWQFRIYGSEEYQGQGWIHNVVPGQSSEGNVINEWYADAQIQGKIGDNLDVWTKFQSAQWFNPSGGPGDQSAGWARVGYPSYEWYSLSDVVPEPGYACYGNTVYGASNVKNASPLGCFNPSINSPWTEAMDVDHSVELPAYYSLNTQWTLHNPGFDIKYIGGGTFYHYELWGPTNNDAPITQFNQPCSFIPNCGTLGLQINPIDSFTYQEKNGFWSDELNFISTGNGPLQWVAGAYQFYQSYQQPVSAEILEQPQLNGPFGVPGALCGLTGGVCAPETLNRWFDNRPAVKDQSYAVYGQIDWKVTQNLKLTLGLRYSYDRKYGTESVRLTCFTLPACYTVPELNPFLGAGGLPAVDLTQLGTVVDAGPPGGPLPTGVTGVTTYSAATGLATRAYNASWQSPSGTAGIEWTPDTDSVYYFKYGRGYKSGGYNIGIFTVLSFEPWTAAEHVDSFEIGAKHTFGTFTVDAAAFWYNYTNLQIPIAEGQDAGGLAQSETAFYNVPASISRGVEFETTWRPIDNLTVLFNYSFNDAYITKGTAADPADPNAVEPNAKPLFTAAQCAATASAAKPDCLADVYSIGVANDPNAGWNIPQNLAGNPLPNAPRNKVAVDVLYDWKLSNDSKLEPSLSYVWRDQAYGLFFKEQYDAAPAWDEWDSRLTYVSPNGKFTAILFIKNIFNTIGYDQGALGTRAAGIVDIPGGPSGYTAVNYVQGLNGPAGYNQHLPGTDKWGVYSTYYVTPPRTVGVELHYKFF